MINEIDIRNFRGFEHQTISGCQRINVIVGDSGSGKTSLLEAIFFGLGMTTELVMRFRQIRGLDIGYRGSFRKIEDAIFGDLFYNMDQKRVISISLSGMGPENRSLRISRGASESQFPLEGGSGAGTSSGGVQFHWKDAQGGDHIVVPTVSSAGAKFPETGEDLPDFFYFAASQSYSSVDNADRFSELRRANRHGPFIELFTGLYKWMTDITIEVVAGSPGIFATVKGLSEKLPISAVSGGINRAMTTLLAIASRPRSVILIDEIEAGLYYKHHPAYWRALLKFARDYDSQLFVSTHSGEWLRSLVEAAEGKVDDISVWRLERGNDGKQAVYQFDGDTVIDGIEYGAEVRGGR